MSFQRALRRARRVIRNKTTEAIPSLYSVQYLGAQGPPHAKQMPPKDREADAHIKDSLPAGTSKNNSRRLSRLHLTLRCNGPLRQASR